MERRVLFSYHESRKVAALPPHSPSDLLLIKELAKSLFRDLESVGDDNILIQAFDSAFEEWVDVDHSFVAEDKQKLKVVANSVAEEEKVSVWPSSKHSSMLPTPRMHRPHLGIIICIDSYS